MSDFVLEPTWAEETEPDVAARKLLLEVSRVEQVNFEWMCDGFVYQQYGSGRRLPNVYGLTTSKACTYPGGNFPSMTAFDITSDNQIAIGVETLTTTVGAARPWCNFTTVDGDYRQRTKAQRKGDYFYGLLKDCGFYAALPEMFRDMTTWGWGVAKSTAAKRGKKRSVKLRIASDRCVPSEVLWDRANNLIPGADVPIYHRRFVLKRDKMREFPEKAEQIANAPGVFTGNIPGLAVDVPADFVCEVDAYWPSSDGETKGRHMTTLGECVVLDETMEPDEGHPFTFLKGYNIGPGWQYQGVVEQTLGDQLRLNKQNAVIWENQHRGASNRWLVDDKSNVSDGSLTNRAAQITRYSKVKPELVVYQTSPSELYQDRDATRTRILKRMGVNDFASQGLKPTGLNSGEALRQYGEKTAPRHVTLGRNLEEFVVDTVKKLDQLCEKVKPVVKAPGKRSVRKLTWDQVKLPDGSYSVELAFPISSLPRTPEGQIDKASEMLQEAAIDKVTYARLTLNPDTTSVIGPLTAARDAIESILDGITEDGEYVAPDDGLALDMAFEMACTRYWRAIADKAPQDIRDMLCDWRDDVKRIMDEKKAAAAPAPAQAAGPAAAPQMIPAGDVIQGPQPTQLAA
jgi:hypothetical protein